MNKFNASDLYDLVSPDGCIKTYQLKDDSSAIVVVEIKNISSNFMGFHIDEELVSFNLKSALAQLGMHAVKKSLMLDSKKGHAEIKLELRAYDLLAKALLSLLYPGAFIGKLFAADDRRKVRDPHYLMRMFERLDEHQKPLLYLGKSSGRKKLVLEKHENHTVAHLSLLKGTVSYEEQTAGALPLLARALKDPSLRVRPLLEIMQKWNPKTPHLLNKEHILLVKTEPLHVRTVFARVCSALLPEGFHHTSANVLEPHTKGSGDIYELFGKSSKEITSIPLEFFTLEPYREHVFFSDRDQLQESLESADVIFDTFKTAPDPKSHRAAVFVTKGTQLLSLKSSDWIVTAPKEHNFPGGLYSPKEQTALVRKCIEEQAIFPFLQAMEDGFITSEGVLFSRYFPSPLMKKNLLTTEVCQFLKRIYFLKPSLSSGNFFSHEDRALLQDLSHFAIPVYWADEAENRVLQYIPKPGKNSGMFVPLPLIEDYINATSFGLYGSNLFCADFEHELLDLFEGLQKLKQEVEHPLLNKNTPIAMVTGGGPGVMNLGNKVAKNLGLLSCANIVDFSNKGCLSVNEQKHNPYIDIKMTYHLDRLIERQAEFCLDFPIFLAGGIGTDFEYSLEELRRKVDATLASPVLLFGDPKYWENKISSRFKQNLATGTIAGSEWVSNCFFCVKDAQAGLELYRKFFSNKLEIGPSGPIYENGFCVYE